MKKLFIIFAFFMLSCSKENLTTELSTIDFQKSFALNFKKTITNGIVSIQTGKIEYNDQNQFIKTTDPIDVGWSNFQIGKSFDNKKLTIHYESIDKTIQTTLVYELLSENKLKLEILQKNKNLVVKFYEN